MNENLKKKDRVLECGGLCASGEYSLGCVIRAREGHIHNKTDKQSIRNY